MVLVHGSHSSIKLKMDLLFIPFQLYHFFWVIVNSSVLKFIIFSLKFLFLSFLRLLFRKFHMMSVLCFQFPTKLMSYPGPLFESLVYFEIFRWKLFNFVSLELLWSTYIHPQIHSLLFSCLKLQNSKVLQSSSQKASEMSSSTSQLPPNHSLHQNISSWGFVPVIRVPLDIW